jgi:hypothetical protein
MSSATSIDGEVRSSAVPAKPVKADSTFRASHFFILSSLLAATVAVVMARQSTPEHLVLISLTIGAAGLAAAGFYRVLSPLVGEVADGTREPVSQRARGVIEREKLLTLRALKDLEFDRSMGKVSQSDFDEMAGRLRTRALALMKQLDEDGSGYRALIERELSARLAAKLATGTKPATPPTTPAPPAAVEAATAGLCTCGTANDPDAVFCKRCGTKLVA